MKLRKPIGAYRQTSNKYGSSTTWQSYKGKGSYYGGYGGYGGYAGKLAARHSRMSGQNIEFYIEKRGLDGKYGMELL